MTGSDKVAEIQAFFHTDQKAAWIRHLWDTYNNQREEWIEQKKELRNYIFATDTTRTENRSLPWKNSTTLPKLCQIRDNLHSNYLQALIPNDKWLSWNAYTQDAAAKQKSRVIEAYMDNKARQGGMRSELSKLLYDYIDGNAFATTVYESRHNETDTETTAEFVGPKVVRISPYDIVFDPTAHSFEASFKIIRSVKTLGELKKLAMYNPDQAFWEEAIARRQEFRNNLTGWDRDDFDKAEGFEIDGFGSLYEYYNSNYVEILEFYGDYHDIESGELSTNRMITVVDRSYVVRDIAIPTYTGRAPIRHVGWRTRPDNLYAMGPLDNLVGMQYRIDHLENAKADAFDLAIQPPLFVRGEIEAFEWGPSSEIIGDENSDIQEVAKNLNPIITCDNQIQILEDKMELFAGAPREAMGVRSPGEKTAFEVQALENAAGRIFQEKITTFEVEFLEKILNDMLEAAKRNLDSFDVVRVTDNDIGVQEFLNVTREDITANGIIRPVGARHFAQQAQELQNLVGIFSSPLGQLVAPHTSGKNMTKFIEDVVDIRAYNIFRENVAVEEQLETQALMGQAQEDLEVQMATPVEDADIPTTQQEAQTTLGV